MPCLVISNPDHAIPGIHPDFLLTSTGSPIIPVPLQRIKNFMIHYLVRIIPVIRKNRNAILVEMLHYSRCAAGTSALSIFTLTDNIIAVFLCRIDKFRQSLRLRKIRLICQPVLRQNRQINVMQRHPEQAVCFSFVIYRGIIFRYLSGCFRVMKTDNRCFLREAFPN